MRVIKDEKGKEYEVLVERDIIKKVSEDYGISYQQAKREVQKTFRTLKSIVYDNRQGFQIPGLITAYPKWVEDRKRNLIEGSDSNKVVEVPAHWGLTVKKLEAVKIALNK